jgi:hypothetical protein|tara:strand:- start:270 stop:407 length:138 start_codon:yes stop_codon:yes gene_type:complete
VAGSRFAVVLVRVDIAQIIFAGYCGQCLLTFWGNDTYAKITIARV